MIFGGGGGHGTVSNEFDWIWGCLGGLSVNTAVCDATCISAFNMCVGMKLTNSPNTEG